MDFLPWLKDSVLPELYFTQWYNSERTTNYDEKFLSNMYAVRLGPPRIRMLRTAEGNSVSTCHYNVLFDVNTSHCCHIAQSKSLFVLYNRICHVCHMYIFV